MVAAGTWTYNCAHSSVLQKSLEIFHWEDFLEDCDQVCLLFFLETEQRDIFLFLILKT